MHKAGEYTEIAVMQMSGMPIEVGIDEAEPSVCLRAYGHADFMHMSIGEAELLIASLGVAVEMASKLENQR